MSPTRFSGSRVPGPGSRSSAPDTGSRNPEIAFLGGGNMARALIGGLLRSGMPAASLRVSEPRAEARTELTQTFGIAAHGDNAEAARGAALWVLAVKPQVLRAVCTGLVSLAQTQRPVVLSIAAGIRSDQIASWLGGDLAVIRAMPNTPALLGVGASGLFANTQVDAAGRALAERVMTAVGISCWIAEEAQMDVVTALSGSGPAYFFLLAEALEEAAVAQGLPRPVARMLAAQTCLGAGRMLREDDVPAAELRQRVTSPGGTTAAALDRLAAGGFAALVAAALTAASRRGGELAAAADH
ncbi:MAG TPA: pyrroline-5-carboxylate reductase [Rhodanobacteraceae bacterium]|nr:pyrroline-5-carboxylate reductase [Rhodanobacteraceae bacterium]